MADTGRVIEAVDASVLAWLQRHCPNTEVTLERPSGEPGKAPVLHLALTDVRADPRGQGADVVEIRDANGHTTGRQAPVQWFQLSYEMTVAATTVAAEHRVLSEVLSASAAEAALPDDCRRGSLAETTMPIYLRVAPPAAERLNTDTPERRHDRTTLDLVVTAPLIPAAPAEVGPPVTEVTLAADRIGTDGPARQLTPSAATVGGPRKRTGMPPYRIHEYVGEPGKTDKQPSKRRRRADG